MEAQAIAPCNAVDDVFGPARDQFEAVIERLRSTGMAGATYSDVETLVEKEGREVLRLLFQGHLDLRGLREVVFDEVVGADGVSRRQRRRGQGRQTTSLFGPVEVTRLRYESASAGVDSLAPLDAELNLPKGRYSHGVAKRLSLEATKGSFDGALEGLERTTGAHVPKRQCEELVQGASQDFDAFYATREMEAIQQEAPCRNLTAMGCDAKGVLVHRDDLREQTRKAAERREDLGQDTEEEGRQYRKRMANAAAVYSIEPHVRSPEEVVAGMRSVRPVGDKEEGPRPQAKRVWASIEKDSEQVVEETVREALRRDPFQWSQWVATVDGDYTLIAAYEKMAEKYELRNLVIICDIIHVLTYLWLAGKVFHPRSRSKAEAWVLHHVLEVLRGRCSHVAAGMRRSATMREFSQKKRKPVDDCARYLLNHKEHLRYDEYLAAGFPISSGVIEGTIRHLVNDRMGITGARWRLASAEAVLRLRALRCSGDFEAYWHFHEDQEQQRNHRVRYHKGAIPRPSPSPAQRHLRAVK
jgi:hypothetical protein